MTTRDDIEKGPRFDLKVIDESVAGHEDFTSCCACREQAGVDKATGLCRACWRAWRFGPAATVRTYGGFIESNIPPEGLKAVFRHPTIEEIRRDCPIPPCPTCGVAAAPPNETLPTSCADMWHVRRTWP